MTVVEPVAEAEVNVPGVMAMEEAPEVVQLRVLLAPVVMPVGLAVKLAMAGKACACTVTVAVAVADPVALVAVRV